VNIGQNLDFSASVRGQVLGYVLPATGSPTWMLLTFILMLFAGTGLKLVSYAQRKNERMEK
jgi:LPXTG-motif cell wall-anchored protein